MRKIFMVGASAAASVLLMTGCNKQVIDLTYEYSHIRRHRLKCRMEP